VSPDETFNRYTLSQACSVSTFLQFVLPTGSTFLHTPDEEIRALRENSKYTAKSMANKAKKVSPARAMVVVWANGSSALSVPEP
jgi:hypothetical protein